MTTHSDTSLILLAAGKGTRLGMPMPKPLVPLGGKPLIEPVIRLGEQLGFAKIVIVISEFTKEIQDRFQGPTIEYVMTEPRGTGDAVLQGLKVVETPLFVVSGADDGYFYEPQMVEDLIAYHKEMKGDLTLAYFAARKPLSSVLLKHDGRYLHGQGLTKEEMELPPPRDISAGLYVGDTAWVRNDLVHVEVDHTGEFPFPTMASRALEQGKTVPVFRVPDGQWHGINTPEDYAEAQRRVGDI